MYNREVYVSESDLVSEELKELRKNLNSLEKEKDELGLSINSIIGRPTYVLTSEISNHLEFINREIKKVNNSIKKKEVKLALDDNDNKCKDEIIKLKDRLQLIEKNRNELSSFYEKSAIYLPCRGNSKTSNIVNKNKDDVQELNRKIDHINRLISVNIENYHNNLAARLENDVNLVNEDPNKLKSITICTPSCNYNTVLYEEINNVISIEVVNIGKYAKINFTRSIKVPEYAIKSEVFKEDELITVNGEKYVILYQSFTVDNSIDRIKITEIYDFN